ncbi:hypothetical protein [Allisonella histaminiformans]|uniref:hypothetical protein n=1 Tax=Allisonella histaminiformans TaxID=209880 RepID=UPI002E785724|nr:hypothetical protein [Allisonella histaminiformans]
MGNIMRYGLLWAATGMAAGILAFSEFSLSWGILVVLYGLCWGILLAAWRLKQVTAVVCICAVLTLLTGYARMGLEQRVWEKQAHCLSGSEGTYQVVLKEKPSRSVYKSGDMRGLAELEKLPIRMESSGISMAVCISIFRKHRDLVYCLGTDGM